ncbi:MAG TPA: hypothetical protein VEL79_19480 [Vicinamibacterales bacterium]|nr:hypothetical protein [Vicinamibacterales bacterium]
MMNDSDAAVDRALAEALRALASGTKVPPADPSREAALLAAFDAAQVDRGRGPGARQYWYMGALAAAAAVLIAIGIHPILSGVRGRPGNAASLAGVSGRPATQPEPPNEFVTVPGAAALPPMESGSLVRMDLPVSMLPSLGVTPPAAGHATVKADLVIGQDGLTRAVRLVD